MHQAPSARARALAERRPWYIRRRPTQRVPDGEWLKWLALAGRGWGKTRVGAEWILERQEAGYGRFALIGRTAADVRDVMVEGESGLLACAPRDNRPTYEPSKRRITWRNGATATCYSSEKPDALRGPQHDSAWADEVAAWKHIQATWDNLLFGLRLGTDARVIATSTPRPLPLIRELLTDPTCIVTRGSTYENLDNLSPVYRELVRRYEGTRLGRQELHGEVLADVPGALLRREQITRGDAPHRDQWRRCAVALDPAAGDEDTSAEMGIIVGAVGWDGLGRVLADRTLRASPEVTARRVVQAFDDYDADLVIVEANNGGDWIPALLRTVRPTLPIRVVHASRGKQARAEPIAALYEKGWILHAPEALDAGGAWPLAELEDQWCGWVPGTGDPSPDRLDADVWLWTELKPDGRPRVRAARDRTDEQERKETTTAPVTSGMLGRSW